MTQMENKKGIQKPAEDKIKAVSQPAGLHNLKAPQGAHKHKKLLGRGPGSGHGKTSTRGSKGQTSRAGRHFYLGFEGGQTPLIRRIPKRGFTNISFKKNYAVMNLDDLNKLNTANITVDLLREKGIITHKYRLVKILGDGAIKNPIKVQAHAFSKQAQEKIQKAGGKIEIINDSIR
ncbi:MAG: 50S ribosomal protein L15 [Candidatus Omnitrophota bacterium]